MGPYRYLTPFLHYLDYFFFLIQQSLCQLCVTPSNTFTSTLMSAVSCAKFPIIWGEEAVLQCYNIHAEQRWHIETLYHLKTPSYNIHPTSYILHHTTPFFEQSKPCSASHCLNSDWVLLVGCYLLLTLKVPLPVRCDLLCLLQLTYLPPSILSTYLPSYQTTYLPSYLPTYLLYQATCCLPALSATSS